jgi:type I restriction enzyme, S subunit
VKRTGFGNETLLSVYRDYGVIEKASRTDNFNNASDDLDSYQLVEPGDLAINKMKAWQGSVAISTIRGIVSPAYFIYQPSHDADPRFLHFLFRSGEYVSAYALFSKGVRINQWDLDPEQHLSMTVNLPPLDEQRQIAEYLDRETGKIDELIAKQEQLIEALAGRRQTLVIMSVTIGVRVNTAMKPSGLKWWGSIPSHWKLPKVGHHFSVVLGKMLDAGRDEKQGEQLLPYIRAGNIQESSLILDDLNEMSFTLEEQVSLDLRRDDLLVVEGGAVGVNQYLEHPLVGMSFQKTVNRVRSLDGSSTRFLGFAIDALRYQGVIDMLCNKSTIAHLTADKLARINFPYPPLEEQAEIVALLLAGTAKIDALISSAQRMIAILRERRTALISAAVTGKIDVRGL